MKLQSPWSSAVCFGQGRVLLWDTAAMPAASRSFSRCLLVLQHLLALPAPSCSGTRCLGGDTGTHGRGWLVSGREAVSSPRLQPFSSASGALYTRCSPSRVSEQTMPIIYFIYVFNTLCLGGVLWLLILCYVFLLKLAAPAAGGFPSWYLLKAEVY